MVAPESPSSPEARAFPIQVDVPPFSSDGPTQPTHHSTPRVSALRLYGGSVTIVTQLFSSRHRNSLCLPGIFLLAGLSLGNVLSGWWPRASTDENMQSQSRLGASAPLFECLRNGSLSNFYVLQQPPSYP